MPADPMLKRVVVDAHHHLWDLSSGRYPWLQQDYNEQTFFLGDYRALQQNFLPADYRRVSADCGVVATVHVEAERGAASPARCRTSAGCAAWPCWNSTD